MEIGDSFRIVLPKSRKKDKWNSCKTPEKEFIITGFTKNDYIYYEDLRTNISCNCEQCGQGNTSRLSLWTTMYGNKEATKTTKRVPKAWVVITQKKAARERNIKLKLILRELK